MDHGQIIIELAPVDGGESSMVWLSGRLPLDLPPNELRRMLRLLATWSGWPVESVLRVGREWGTWFDSWIELLSGMKEHHLELHYGMRRVAHDRWSD